MFIGTKVKITSVEGGHVIANTINGAELEVNCSDAAKDFFKQAVGHGSIVYAILNLHDCTNPYDVKQYGIEPPTKDVWS